MSERKYGVILQDKCMVSLKNNEDYIDMLLKSGIADNSENASKLFVVVKIIPQNNDWLTDPATWEFDIDQDVIPEWFINDRDAYEQKLRNEVILWKEEHVFENKDFEVLSEGYYLLKNCRVKELEGEVEVVLLDSVVDLVKDGAVIIDAYGNSVIHKMMSGAIIYSAFDNTRVDAMYNASRVHDMWNNSSIGKIYDVCHVCNMYGKSSIDTIADLVTVEDMNDNSVINIKTGNASVWRVNNNAKIKASGKAHVLFIKTIRMMSKSLK